MVVWIAALAGGLALAWPGVSEGARGAPRVVPALLALSHLAAVVLLAPTIYMVPNVYGERLVFPLAVLMLPYAATGLAAVVRGAAGSRPLVRPAPAQ
jgi:hypothetical protein